jgi:aminoglycoside phosphotransferase family enzyme/predicted kinase
MKNHDAGAGSDSNGNRMDMDRRLLEFLLNPDAYPEKPSRIDHIETSISHVFLGDHFVYKIKKPVNFGYCDFSTLKKRHHYCREEVVLNRKLAADIYIGVVPIYRRGDMFSFKRSKACSVADHAVKMKKIPDGCILFNLIEQGKPLYGELEEIGKILSVFHNNTLCYRGSRYGGVKTIQWTSEQNFSQVKPFCDITINREFLDTLTAYTRNFIDAHRDALKSRKKDGFIRKGHGDLHSQHICLTRPPVIFDCIEFNEAFRVIDILQDIAFLLMDLEYRGRFDLSRRLLKSYSAHQKSPLPEDLLRFYKVYRAVVRGKVDSLLFSNSEDLDTKQRGLKMATDYFKLAEHYIRDDRKPFNPVVIMGLSGSGKSTIAKDITGDWIILRSDEMRKRAAGVKKGEHMYSEYGEKIYSDEMTREIYSLLLDKATRYVLDGHRVIVDATYLKSTQRMSFYNACIERGLNPFFIQCFANEAFLRERIVKRMQNGADVSDAHLGILDRQLEEMEEPFELPYFRVLRLNTEEAVHKTAGALKEFL